MKNCIVMARATLSAFLNAGYSAENATTAVEGQILNMSKANLVTREEAAKWAREKAGADPSKEYLVFELREGHEKEPPPPPPVQKTKYTDYCTITKT